MLLIYGKVLGSHDINSNRVRCKLKYKNSIKEAAANGDSVFNDVLVV